MLTKLLNRFLIIIGKSPLNADKKMNCFHTRRYDVAHTLAKPAELDGIGFSQSNSKYFLMITVIPIKHHVWNSREAQFWQQEASI